MLNKKKLMGISLNFTQNFRKLLGNHTDYSRRMHRNLILGKAKKNTILKLIFMKKCHKRNVVRDQGNLICKVLFPFGSKK